MTTIAVAQLALTIGEPNANRNAAAEAIAEAAAQHADLVVLPELSDSGYVFAGEPEARSLAAPGTDDNPTLAGWRAHAERHDLAIAGGFCELGDDGRLYNSAALVTKDGTKCVYRKAHLWDAEKLVFVPGDAPSPVVELPFGRVSLVICYDLEFPEWIRLPALAGADLIAAPVNWPAAPRPEGERAAEVVKAQAAASANGVFVAVADRCRQERGVDWVSGSLIAGPDGYPLAGPASSKTQQVISAKADLTKARDKKISARNDLLADRRPQLYGRVASALASLLEEQEARRCQPPTRFSTSRRR